MPVTLVAYKTQGTNMKGDQDFPSLRHSSLGVLCLLHLLQGRQRSKLISVAPALRTGPSVGQNTGE